MRFLAGLVCAALLAVAAPARSEPLVDTETLVGPGEPAREFPDGFVPPLDAQRLSTSTQAAYAWSQPYVGGWGSNDCPAGHTPRRPVIFVHGNSEDASFWRAAESGEGTVVHVRDRFLADGYCLKELWAISYTGAKGYLTSNDLNVDDVYGFIGAVRSYLDLGPGDKVDVVAHSLGVTVVRKALYLHYDELKDQIGNLILVAGANHGTTTCRGVGAAHGSRVCEEVEPGSDWLAELNAGPLNMGEAPPGPRYLTIYEGAGVADHFYLGPDGLSPRLDAVGVCNVEMPLTPHYTLARGAGPVATMLAFLRDGTCPDEG